jgi:hypothetical protein
MVAEQLARRGDPLSLAAYTDRVPPEARGAWMGAVAQAYARTDAQAALNWVEQFRGDAAYGAAAARTAQVLAQNDPVAAARLLGTLEQKSPEARSTARGVAFGWAQQDPVRATEWALNLSDAEMRTNAVQAVAQSWASRDTASARGWALSLANGGTRDAALHAIVSSLAATSTPDQAVLTAFSTEADRQQALRTSLMRIAQRSEAEARQFINGYFTDSAAREQAEQLLETARQRPVMVSPSGFPFGPGLNVISR